MIYNNKEKYNIYILKSFGGNGKIIYKLGYSSNIVKRIRHYAHHNPLIEVVGLYCVETPKKFEKRFHETYTAEIYNEWYSEDMLSTMLLELNKESHTNKPVAEVLEMIKANRAKGDYRNTFKGIIEKLYELSQNKEMALEYQQLFADAIEEYPFLETAVHHYGWDRLKEMKFHKNNIQRAGYRLKAKENKESIHNKTYNKIAMILINDGKFRNGNFYTTREIKEYFTKVHERLGIKAPAKGNDIEKYFSTTYTHKRVDGKTVAGYEILHNLQQLKK